MKNRKDKILPMTKQVLVFLEKMASNLLDHVVEMTPSKINRLLCYGHSFLKIEERERQERQIKRALYELERKRYLNIKKEGGKIFYALTQKGLNDATLAKIRNTTKKLADEQYCMICFDIPEAAKDVRKILRRFLKIAGFSQLQKSVWYTKQDIFNSVCLYIESVGAGKWVKVIKATLLN